jgi:hypothetical protein
MLDTAVRPLRLVRVVMGPMTRVLNPLVKKLAGRRHFMMAAQIHHVGRPSGRAYVTPASARIRLGGVDYQAVRPELVDRADARAVVRQAYGPFQRAAFRVLGIMQVMVLRLADRPVS